MGCSLEEVLWLCRKRLVIGLLGHCGGLARMEKGKGMDLRSKTKKRIMKRKKLNLRRRFRREKLK